MLAHECVFVCVVCLLLFIAKLIAYLCSLAFNVPAQSDLALLDFTTLVLVLKKIYRNNTVKSLTTISTLSLHSRCTLISRATLATRLACYAFVLPIKVQLEMLCKSERFLLAISMPAVCSMYLCIDVSVWCIYKYVCSVCV